ncbi:MAG: hypothetical protein HOO91_09950 [Bacteroidales bacterium]|nr:hypothetical protein [Bacteroidales bacterium]
MTKKIKHINYALVESVRPPMYKATKYWGKKPHNIWRQFIEAYSDVNDIVLDPFSGSSVAAFEAVKSNRKAIAFDLNPITCFTIESICSDFNESKFKATFNKIEKEMSLDSVYKEHFITNYNGNEATIFNYKWEDGKIARVSLKTGKESFSILPDKNIINITESQNKISIPFWFPTDKFPVNPSITHKFIKDIGGDSFENLWTRRNLYILSKIFSIITNESDNNVKIQLLSGFIQTLHLCSKMVVPRNPKSNRDFSGSWGRADYMIRRRSMEQNPFVVFRRSCLEKQGIVSALKDFKKKFPNGIKIYDAKKNKKINRKADINYGAIDIADLADYIPENSIDFIITDPPYAGLVYYMDLSLIWLVWLKKVDIKYEPDLRPEITIKKGSVERPEYRRRMENAFKNIHRVLKDEGYLVVTFHHKKIEEWNDFVRSVKYSGFKFDKITHQYNKRSGESNVSNPYGTSGADFYIRCVKHRDVDFSDDQSGLEHFIKQKAIDIIAERNQPTPLTILTSGLIPELLQAGFFQPDEYKKEIEKILIENCGEGKVFKSWKNEKNKAGEFWWFNNPNDYINFPDLPLDRRVEDLIISILRKNVSVKFDDIIGQLFKTFPNGLTPDPRSIVDTISKYAYKSSEKWKIKDETLQSITQHTRIIEVIIKIGNKAKHKTFVGRREQPELASNGKILSTFADYLALKNIKDIKREALNRVEMIDALWIDEELKIKCVFEVENSTDFTSAIQRASNLGNEVPKIMVIPDKREMELLRIKDPYFLYGFENQNWCYLTYSDLSKASGYSKVDLNELIRISRKVNE